MNRPLPTLLFTLALAAVSAGCSDGTSHAGDSSADHDGAATHDASPMEDTLTHGDDAAVPSDASESDGATASALHGCTDDRFVDETMGTEDDRMIHTAGSRFTPPCMTVRAGQSVMFMWSFASHPLAGGVAPGEMGEGTTPSPIGSRSSGSVYTVAFPTAGNYPFYCTTHAGDGMVGVIRVVP